MIGVLGGMGPLATADFFAKVLAGRIFDAPLMTAGYRLRVPEDESMDRLVLPGIELVKAGQTPQAGPLIEQTVRGLLQEGADAVVLACTETPVALDGVQSPLRGKCVDSTAALARACVAWWRRHSHSSPAT